MVPTWRFFKHKEEKLQSYQFYTVFVSGSFIHGPPLKGVLFIVVLESFAKFTS